MTQNLVYQRRTLSDRLANGAAAPCTVLVLYSTVLHCAGLVLTFDG